MLADMIAGVERVKVRYVFLLLITAIAVAITGCTGAAPGAPDQNVSAQDLYASAYYAGVERHYAGECQFNNGTAAWDSENFGQAISDYANSSTEYDAAAANYEAMERYAADEEEKSFSAALRQCSVNMSKAATDFMEAAIALQAEDTENAYDLFTKGQERVTAGESFLNRSVYLVPTWLQNETV